MFDLTNYVSIITGGAQGLGKYMALALAEYGSNIVIPDINIKLAQKTAKEIGGKGVKSIAFEMDVRNVDQIEKMTLQVIKEFGKIDVLVNNAGITRHVPIEDMDYSAWKELMDINLDGVFLVSHSVGKQMIKQKKGSIINISSMSGVIVNMPQCQAAYNTSKAAVIMLTKCLASEWAKHNIRVNTIAPGYMNIGVAEEFFRDKTELAKKWIELTPMGRPGEPEELGGIAVYLASEASSYVTGGVFTIDGGYTIW